MIETFCNFCKSKDNFQVIRSEEFRYVKCRKCGLVYQNPQPDFNHLKSKVYVDKYFQYELRNETNFVNLMELNLRDLGFHDLFNLNRIEGKKFLDIGSATGLLLSKMRNKGWDVEGVELTKRSASYAISKYKVKVHNKTLEKVGYKSGTFDAVHMSHVIEHVPDPKETLNEIYRILKKGGYFVIVTPNIDSFQARIFNAKWRSAHKDHLTLFSIKTLKKYLKNSGFKIIRQFSYGGLAKGLPPEFLKKPIDTLVRILNIGDVMAFLCKK